MRNTIKAAKLRLARFETSKVYSYAISGNRVTKRVGVYKIGA